MNEEGFIPDDGFEEDPPTPRASLPMDDPTASQAGGPPMSREELFDAGIGQGAMKVWMGARDVAGRVPGLGGIRPTESDWEEFQSSSAPLIAATRSADSLERLPVAMQTGDPATDAELLRLANASLEIQPGKSGSDVGVMAATAPVAMLAGGAARPLIGRVLPAGAQGAVTGAIEGAAAGASMADQGDRLKGAGVGAAGGGLLGWLLQKSGMFVPRRQTGTKPARVPVTPEAQRLEAAGVTGLTPGQKAPQSTVGVLERASAENPLGLGPQRAAAREEFNAVARNQGVAPGAPPPPTIGNPQDQVRSLLDGFAPAYDRFSNLPADQAALVDVLQASSMPRAGVPQSVAGAVRGEVDDALTILGPRDPMKPTTVGDLMKVRETIRDRFRMTDPVNSEKRELLSLAEDAVTEGIERSMSPADQALLRQTDRQYARLMTALDAAPSGQDAFTPLQYLKQIEKRAGRRAFKSGGAGDLQDLGEAARSTFADLPLTGVRPGALSAIPGAKMAGAPLSRLAATPSGQRFLFAPRPTFAGPQSSAPGASAIPADLLEWILAREAALASDEGTGRGSGT